MNTILKRILKIALGTVLAVTILLTGAFATLNSATVQKKLLDKAVAQLRAKLDTRVTIDSLSINVLTQDITLYGIEIEDREERQMLMIERIGVDIELWRLLQHKIVIEQAEAEGVKAMLLKPSKEEAANYQFVIDAFKKPKDQKKGAKMELDISTLSLKDIHVRHNELCISLLSARYDKGWLGGQSIEADSITLSCDTTFRKGLKPYKAAVGRLTANGDFKEQTFKVDGYQIAYQWQSLWKKRHIMVDNQAAIAHITVDADHGRYAATVKQARYKNDNHLPRKNTGRPKRGFFDAKHLDVIADFHVVLDSIGKERITGHLDEFQAKDSVTGIDIRQLQTKFEYIKEKIHLRDIMVQQKSTTIKVASGDIVLPSKKESRQFAFSTGQITGRAYLKDISRAFAPVLRNFSLPLNLSLTMKGTATTISFRNVKVSNDNKKLQIAATGDITNLKDKYNLMVKFSIHGMHAQKGVAQQIINQFPVKKMMMKQLDNLGDLNYTGTFSVLYKKQVFGGVLKTGNGDLNFDFTLDNLEKYVNGKVSSKNLELGKVMNINGLGALAASAQFTVDISKPRTAEMRRQKGGKLPIGYFNATVDDCLFKGIHFRNISATLNSDGAIAEGDVYKSGRIRDLFFHYSFTNTDEMHKMKITKPGIKFHRETDEYKAQKAERKMQKELDKQQRKQQKEEEKRLKKQKKASGDNDEGEQKGFFKRLFSKKKKTEAS